jgi:hypothetical protein
VASRTAYPSVEVDGDILTAANFDRLPGGWIGYVEATTNQTTITTVVDLTSLSVAVTVGTNRRLRITGKVNFTSTVANDGAKLRIQESATVLNAADNTTPTGAGGVFIFASAVLTPTAGTHTYKLTLARTGTGTLTMNASATEAAYLLVEDIGPAS